MIKNTPRLAAALFLAALSSRADAFPAFARKYGMSCTACHIAWPILNAQGERFRDNGYQFGQGKDDPVTLNPGYVPIALRTTPAYQYTRMTNQTADDGTGTGGTKPITVASGGLPQPPGVDILTGGSISDDVSFLLVLSGFAPDGAAAVESGWVRLNRLGGSTWANLRIGKFELDLPMSPHRGISLTYGYAAYAPIPGSLVPFDFGENQVGLELSGADDRSSLRYSLSLTSVNGGEVASGTANKGAWSAPMLYGHVQKSFETGSGALPWVRIGALGGVGWWPTKFETSDGTTPIDGTGSENKQFSRFGLEASGILGNAATPLFVTIAWIRGQDAAELSAGGVKNSYNAFFVEADWVPWSVPDYVATPWVFFARYDAARYKNGPGDVNGFTVGARRYLALGPRASAAVHLEFHQDKVKGVGWEDVVNGAPPRDVETQAILAGIDFDF
jgi:hypothetical protein